MDNDVHLSQYRFYRLRYLANFKPMVELFLPSIISKTDQAKFRLLLVSN